MSQIMRFCYSMTANQCYLIPKLAEQDHVGFEIRLDSFEKKPDFKALRALTDRPLLATFRSKPHLGLATTRARDRKGWAWRQWSMEAGFDLIDIELDEPGLAARMDEVHRNDLKTVLSHHELGDNAGLEPAFDKALETDASIIKIIGSGWSSSDFLLQRQHYQRASGRAFVHFYMGAEFTASRVMSLIYGAPFTFITPFPGEAVAPGQLTREDVEEIYQPDRIELSQMKLFSVIGLPIGHSRSPMFHNPKLREIDQNALFVPLPASSREDFLSLKEAFPELSGCAVTKPMKEVAYQEANRFLDPNSESLGAVNTLILDDDIAATNTDLLAMIEILENLKDIDGEATEVLILGYGGLGRAVVRACSSLGIPALISNRTPGRVDHLPEGVTEIPWSERHKEGPTIVVQATSAGMSPHTAISPMETLPESVKYLIETIYNPAETRLMKMAREQNIEVIDGMALFEGQARIQNRFFIDRLNPDCAD